MDVIPIAEISVGLTMLALTVGVIWRIVDGGTRRMQDRIEAHTVSEAMTLTRLSNATDEFRILTASLVSRVERLEARQESLPSHNDVHQVSMALAHLAGEFKGMTSRLDGVDKVIERLDSITKRQEDYLLSRAK